MWAPRTSRLPAVPRRLPLVVALLLVVAGLVFPGAAWASIGGQAENRIRGFDLVVPVVAGVAASSAAEQHRGNGGLRSDAPSCATLAAGAGPKLPPFDGETTQGGFVSAEGKTIPLQSGGRNPAYSNYPAAGHVEGKAAIEIRNSGSSGGTVYHNNPGGTCGYCDLHDAPREENRDKWDK
jgi:hypothetical protein